MTLVRMLTTKLKMVVNSTCALPNSLHPNQLCKNLVSFWERECYDSSCTSESSPSIKDTKLKLSLSLHFCG